MYQRFKVVSQEDIFKYTLPESMADYTNKILVNYVPGKKLKSLMLVENPVPNNTDATKRLDKVL